MEVEITSLRADIHEAAIRPRSAGIAYELQGNSLVFRLDRPCKLSIEVNGDRFHNLHLFANPLETDVPDPSGENVDVLEPGIHCKEHLEARVQRDNGLFRKPNVIYFAPGMHWIEETLLHIPSDTTVYLAGGAVLMGSLVCTHAENVTICGRGIIYLEPFHRFSAFRAIRLQFSRNVLVEGVIVVDPPHYSIYIGQSENITIRNFKAFSTRGWSDGIDIMASSRIEIDDIFMRNSDDCIAIYGSRWQYKGNSSHIRVRNAILWADVAHALNMGGHGNHLENGDTIHDIRFENIDVLEHHEPQPGYRGALSINAGDNNVVRDVVYENIRVEDIETCQLFDIRVLWNKKYNPVPGKAIENVDFRNIIYDGKKPYPSRIHGYDAERGVTGVRFIDVRINGAYLSDLDPDDFDVNNYATRISLERSGRTVREELQVLVDRAERLLEENGGYYTEGAKLALVDMLRSAKEALAGRARLPFIRNREFFLPREEEAAQFALERYTMAPPFRDRGSVYSRYGLKAALEWFEGQDLRNGGLDALRERIALAVGKARELLSQSRLGKAPGCYCREAAVRLEEAVSKVEDEMNSDIHPESGSLDVLAEAAAACFDRLREFRHSRVLRTDIDLAASLYLTQEGLERVKTKIAADPLLKGQYEQIARISDLYSPEDIERVMSLVMSGEDRYQEMNKHFYLWSSTDKLINFKTPAGAAKATVSFVLPAEENEQAGLGHVWIDNVEILSASGENLNIPNGGFDEGEGEQPFAWRPQSMRGNPVMEWESRYPFCGGGDRKRPEVSNPSSQVRGSNPGKGANRSLYICNPTGQDEGAWSCTQDVAVDGEGNYTLTFQAKLDGKLKRGLKAVITFKNRTDQVIGTYSCYFNRKSSLPGGCFLLPMQCDAIQYALTGDLTLARKVKNQLLYVFHDFCQGAEHWMVTNLRPEGSDSYGAVQGGRVLCAAAVSYSFIRNAGVFADEEKARFYALTEYMLRYMLDLRDRTEWTPFEAQEGCSNWQTDMCAGTAYMMMTLPDFPNRQTWLNNAHFILKAQLELNVNPDSSWPESIRYHHAALERFAGYAKVADNVLGENWFADTPLLRMFGFSVDVQTPGYAYFDGRIGTPPFGDHALGSGAEFGMMATYLPAAVKLDRELADRMYHTWKAAGKPFKRLWGESIALENILGEGDAYKPSSSLSLVSTGDYPDAGITVFRKGFGSGSESYFAIMSSPKRIGHGHLDQGSFILYKNSIPLVMDSGIEGYFDSSTPWHISSYSHACLQFATRRTDRPTTAGGAINLSAGTYSLERGWVDVPPTSKVLERSLGNAVESITIEIANPEGEGRHIRHVMYIREPDLYLIRDTLENFDGPVLFSLPVAAEQATVEGKRVDSRGVYGVDLETVFLTPVTSIRLEQGRSTPFFGSRDSSFSMMSYIRAVAEASQGFLTVLYPKERGASALRTETGAGACILHTDQHRILLEAMPGAYGMKLLEIERL
ncbi:hypothetical protein HMSSN036_47480 [Paenibacillus macerans]|nr:hypothetical protein HMSSN036_47480 [Paenibacillus macerans]